MRVVTSQKGFTRAFSIRVSVTGNVQTTNFFDGLSNVYNRGLIWVVLFTVESIFSTYPQTANPPNNEANDISLLSY